MNISVLPVRKINNVNKDKKETNSKEVFSEVLKREEHKLENKKERV